MQDITIVFGNEINFTQDGEVSANSFVKFSTLFRKKQLKELKGAPLSVFLCYALHCDQQGYTWVSDKTVKKETGYSSTSEIRNKLIKMKYLYQGKLRNKKGQFKAHIYRIFQPIEENKCFLIKGEKLFTYFNNNNSLPQTTDIGESLISVSPPHIEEDPKVDIDYDHDQEQVNIDNDQEDQEYEVDPKEKKKKELYNSFLQIFEFWNSLKMITHRLKDGKIPLNIQKAIAFRLKTATVDEILQAIETYHIIAYDPKRASGSPSRFWFNYRWTLAEFLTRKGAWEKFGETPRKQAIWNHLKSDSIPKEVFADYGITYNEGEF